MIGCVECPVRRLFGELSRSTDRIGSRTFDLDGRRMLNLLSYVRTTPSLLLCILATDGCIPVPSVRPSTAGGDGLKLWECVAVRYVCLSGLSSCLSVCLSPCLPVFPFVLYACPQPMRLNVYLSVCLSVFVSICTVCVGVSIYPSIYRYLSI